MTFFSGAIFAWILAIAQFWRRQRHQGNFIFSALFFCLGYWLFYATIFYIDRFADYPWLIMTHIPITLCIGPLGYMYFQYLIVGTFNLRRRDAWHFATAVLRSLA